MPWIRRTLDLTVVLLLEPLVRSIDLLPIPGKHFAIPDENFIWKISHVKNVWNWNIFTGETFIPQMKWERFHI